MEWKEICSEKTSDNPLMLLEKTKAFLQLRWKDESIFSNKMANHKLTLFLGTVSKKKKKNPIGAP
jgi:hypothetical protein